MVAGAPLPLEYVDVFMPPLRAGTWRCCSGRGSTTALGMRGHVTFAARGGHLEVLQWARVHHCPWDHRVRTHAADEEIRQWAIAHGCPDKAE